MARAGFGFVSGKGGSRAGGDGDVVLEGAPEGIGDVYGIIACRCDVRWILLRGGVAIGPGPLKSYKRAGCAFGGQLESLLGGAAAFAEAVYQGGDLYGGMGGEEGEEEERGGEEVVHDGAVDCGIR